MHQDAGEETRRNMDTSIEMEGLITSMRGKLGNLSPLCPNCCIYRVPKIIREVDERAYTPVNVSIGPLHHGNEDLKDFEEHKWRYLKDFLQHSPKPLEYFLEFIKTRENSIRECYAETISFKSDKFVEIILVDAAFIIEALLKEWCSGLKTSGDPIRIHDVWLEFIMLENQLPFFVLNDLYVRANLFGGFESIPGFIDLACEFIARFSNQPEIRKDINPSSVKHFTDLLRRVLIPREHSRLSNQPEIRKDINSSRVKHFTDLLRRVLIPREHSQPDYGKNEYIKTPTAKELHSAGIKFKASSSNDIFDIKFISGVLKISKIKIYDVTKGILRNLLAFEQCHYNDFYMTQYVAFLDNLIDSSEDVELLVECGVIDNWLGDNEAVAILFNTLGRELVMKSHSFYFAKPCKEINDHCKIHRHKWMATLRRDYCKTPWRVTSIVAGAILLVLTFIQTVCSIMSAGN